MQEGLLALKGGGAYVCGHGGGNRPGGLFSLWFGNQGQGSAMYAYGTHQGQRVRTYQLAVDLLAQGDYPAKGWSPNLPLSAYRQAFGGLRQTPAQSVKVAFDLR